MRKNAFQSAEVCAEEVPIPCCTDGTVVIANRHSLISAGTETTAVGSTKGDMVKKALGDPDIRQAVVDMLVQDGISKTADRVQHEFTKWTPLGYSGAGIAAEVGSQIEGIKPGDLVAYGGEHHAEYVRAAKNLCVHVPEGVSTREAAFATVGSIAMQAVRRADSPHQRGREPGRWPQAGLLRLRRCLRPDQDEGRPAGQAAHSRCQ